MDYNNQQPQKKVNGVAIAALVAGVLGLIIALFVNGWVGLVISVVAIVLGAIGMKKAKETNSGKGLAVAGLVCGIVSTAICVIVIIAAFACASAIAGAVGSLAY